MCGVSVGAVKKWIAQGKLGAIRTPGGHFRIAAEEFERFRSLHRFPRGAPAELRILVVDDDQFVVKMLLGSLRAIRPEPRLDAAFDGYEGLLKVGTFRPHLLILDLHLPGLDGVEVCRRIKADPVTRATRIAAMTGAAADGIRERAFAAGADVFLTKPIELRELTEQASQLLHGGRSR